MRWSCIISQIWFILNIGGSRKLYNFRDEVRHVIGYDYRIETRVKSCNSYVGKLIKNHHTPCDVLGMRIIYSSNDTYTAYLITYFLWGYLSRVYPNSKFKLKDYIETPKENDYKSLHLSFNPGQCPFEKPIEIQIRSEYMHWDSIYGKPSLYHIIRDY